MKAIILAAGYATKMYPLTRNQSQALLPLGGNLIIDYAIKQLEEIKVTEIIIVTNQRFFSDFAEWKKNLNVKTPIILLNNGSISVDDRLGLVGDLCFAIYAREISEEIVVLAGSHYIDFLDFSIKNVYNHFIKQKRDTVCVINNTPAVCYFFRIETLPVFPQFFSVAEPEEMDSPDYFGNWLIKEHADAFEMDVKYHRLKSVPEYESLRTELTPNISRSEIFFAFAKVGALTFGAGYNMLPLLNKEMAVRRKWVTKEEIMDYFAISQCLPGLGVVKTSALLGYRYKKGVGATCAGFGVAFPLVAISLLIAVFFDFFIEFQLVRYAFNGMQIAVLCLIIEAVIQTWKKGITDIFGIVLFILAVALMIALDLFGYGTLSMIVVLIGGLAGIVFKPFEKKSVK